MLNGVSADQLNLKPIGILKTVFKYKNGTPRQPTVCLHARGVLTIDNSVFNNPQHSLEGLEQFSHIWLVSTSLSSTLELITLCSCIQHPIL